MNALYIPPHLKRKVLITKVMFWLGVAGWLIFYALRESTRTDARLEIFEALIKAKYKGFVDLEYEIHADDPMPGVIGSFAYMRGNLAGMGYLSHG